MANPLKLLKLKIDGFQFIQETAIDAPPKKVWSSLLDINKWFGFEAEDALVKHTFEAWPGGRWIYEEKDGSVSLNTIITRIEPHKLLRLSGPMGMTHLPVQNVVIFELKPRGGGKKTLLRLAQRTFGYIDKDVKKRYASGWKQLLPNLKKIAEGR
jgi:uncharacterized protein YndB with AHSA1/START domain